MDKAIERIEKLHILLVLASAALGGALGLLHPPSLILGGIAMGLNFWLLKKVVRKVVSLSREGQGKIRAWIWILGKTFFSFSFLGALLFYFPIQGGSFLFGVSLLLVACVIIGLSRSDKEKLILR